MRPKENGRRRRTGFVMPKWRINWKIESIFPKLQSFVRMQRLIINVDLKEPLGKEYHHELVNPSLGSCPTRHRPSLSPIGAPLLWGMNIHSGFIRHNFMESSSPPPPRSVGLLRSPQKKTPPRSFARDLENVKSFSKYG